MLKFCKSKKGIVLICLLITGCIYWFSLSFPLFKAPTCTVLEDQNGKLVGAKIASDGQWRFPFSEVVPEKFKRCIIEFEDRKFGYHPGFDPLAFVRALVSNIRSTKIKSGGSTITMQVIRLSKMHSSRTFFNKIIEVILATRLELSYSKKEILALYASNAPFGGNVVGLEAASWRYFGRGANELSWSESATLAVLPNSPSLIYPGKNQERLRKKRNRLLTHLWKEGIITKETYSLAVAEPLPGKPFAIPHEAQHLLNLAFKSGHKETRIRSTLDVKLQESVSQIIEKHHKTLEGNNIHNAAALILDVKTGNILAYVGNTANPNNPEHGSDVDVITSPRSTGSILKPFLYAAMLHEGSILPNTLVPDIPTQIAGFMPKNFNLSYDGAVMAKQALSRSLNVPIVRMLQNFGIEKFSFTLKKLGLTTLNKPAEHYGLSVILGGAEATLFDLAGVYGSMARTLNNFSKNNGRYNRKDFHPPNYIFSDEPSVNSPATETGSILSAGSIWLTFEAMVEVARPDEEANWNMYLSSQKIAWKTGTSYGFRDGWAIGVTPSNVVAVWVGNADGEGRPGLTGVGAAAPILFDIFGLLKPGRWFEQPYDELRQIPVCHHSGYRASDICEMVDSIWVEEAGLKTAPCPYHKLIHLDASEKWRVNSDCEDVAKMVHKSWFVLPPAQEWYYKTKNPTYSPLPPLRPDCSGMPLSSMELIYPRQERKIYVPLEIDGKLGRTIFEVAHRIPKTTIYWHVDDKFVGSTKEVHQMSLNPEKGMHVLTLVDMNGETLRQSFEVMGR